MFDAVRTGSHNVVVGGQHEWTLNGGLVVGVRNQIRGAGASVTGGDGNVASGVGSSVSGGFGNTAAGDWSTVVGGLNNRIESAGTSSSILGGSGKVVNMVLTCVPACS